MNSQSGGNVAAFIFQNSDMSHAQARNVWAGLQKGIQEIQNGNASTLRFEELYRNAYTLVLHKHGELLYKGVERTILEQLDKVMREVIDTTENQILEVVVKKWKHHKLTMTMIRDILMYMDKTYCEIKRKRDSFNLGVLKFKQNVVMNTHVLERVMQQLLDNIRLERDGEKIDESLVRNCLRMLVELDASHSSDELYDRQFQDQFIEQTRLFYRNESELFIVENSVPEYLRKAERRLDEEKNRAESYIPKSETRQLLEKTVEQEIIGRYKETLVDHESSGVKHMFERSAIDDLRRMYDLLARVDAGNGYLRNALYEHVKGTGEKIVSDESNLKNPEKFVREVLDIRAKYQEIVTAAFVNDKHFQRALKEAFEYFINLDTRAAQFLSLFTDALLRKHCLKMSENEVLERLDDVITIFKYLKDKDIFEDFYKQHLAQRLLHGKGTNDVHERSMIARLKTECGHQFTSKLEGMFKDIAQSKRLQEEWEQHLARLQVEYSVDLDVNVLTTGYWPFPNKEGCQLPLEVGQQCERFTEFYVDKHSGRRLRFDTSRGTAEVAVAFDAGEKILVVHTYQMVVLMLFNQKDVYSWQEMKQRTGVEPEVLERHVLALAHPKVKVLLKKPNRKELADNHQFMLNRKYRNQRVRVEIGVLDPKKTQVSSKKEALPKHVQEARKNRVEAAIVRIMKARKTLAHPQLVAEVVRQLAARFQPDPFFIKQRIASLIEREYLRRDEDDRRVYHYVA